MSQLPTTNCCQTSCDGTTPVLVPGPAGENGSPGEPGEAGSSGVNSYTTLGANFTMPAEGANSASTVVGQSTSFVVGQIVYLLGAGWLQVISKADAIHMVLKNLKNTAAGTYASNVVAGTVIVNGSPISPAGLQGPVGIQGIPGNVGATGAGGAAGASGTNGKNSFTTTSSNFTQPAVGANVSIAVLDSSWAVVNQIVFSGGGYYKVISKANALEMTIQNLGYAGNVVPGTVITSGAAVSPGGLRGQTVQCVLSSTNAASNVTTTIPWDDTKPTNTEGTQLLTAAITPTNVNSTLVIEALVTFTPDGSDTFILALFQDAVAPAAAAVFTTATDSNPNQLALTYYLTAGSVAATTFKIRVGSGAGTGMSINGVTAGSRRLGGACIAVLKVTEFAP